MSRRISIFGATGSIGQNTLDLIKRAPDDYDVIALTGGHNIAQLAADALQVGAKLVVTAHDQHLPALRQALEGSGIEAAAGPTALCEAAPRPADWVMSAIVGAAGLEPGVRALQQGATLALANKESMVCAGPLMLATARANGGTILPVDSEHSALFQALNGEPRDAVDKVIITASGGAFRDWPLADLAHATPEQAATHPNWSMGTRITIDSASMFNKALELIEAKELFGFDPDQIEACIHPESVVHAMVAFRDGGMIGHMGVPDMRHAIGYALHHPNRDPLPVKTLDLLSIGQLNFREVCPDRYPALRLARQVMEAGGLHGAVFNAAKEVALDAFLQKRIGFLDMAAVVERVLDRLSATNGLNHADIDLDTVLRADLAARDAAKDDIHQTSQK